MSKSKKTDRDTDNIIKEQEFTILSLKSELLVIKSELTAMRKRKRQQARKLGSKGASRG